MNDPGFAGLDQALQLYSSAVVVAHFGARGGGMQFIDKMMKDFRAAQSPEDLIARINAADDVLDRYAKQAGVNVPHPGGQGAGAAPKEGDMKTNGAGDKVKFTGGEWVVQ